MMPSKWQLQICFNGLVPPLRILADIEEQVSVEIEEWVQFPKRQPPGSGQSDFECLHWMGGAIMTRMTTVQALNSALRLKMAEDDRVFCLGEDIGWMGGDFGVTRGLFDGFGAERVRNTPSPKRPLSVLLLVLPWSV